MNIATQPDDFTLDVVGADIGHNRPPSAIDDAQACSKSLSDYLAAHPVVQTEDDARKAKLFLDRGTNTLAELEAAEKKETAPLYKSWKAAIAKYKPATDHLTKIIDQVKARLTVFARAEEERRVAAAEAARKIAEEAERVAREAERVEAEAKENASLGEVGVDVGAAIETADTTFSQFERANRVAELAERDSHVRIGGGLGRVSTLRTKETLVLEDAVKAIAETGVTEKIREAVLSSARDYRKLHGKLPTGVKATTERVI